MSRLHLKAMSQSTDVTENHRIVWVVRDLKDDLVPLAMDTFH